MIMKNKIRPKQLLKICVSLLFFLGLISMALPVNGADKVEAQIGLGLACEAENKYTEARTEFEKVLAIDAITPEQRARTLVRIGAAYLGEKKDNPAFDALQKARAIKEISNATLIEGNMLLGQTWLKYPWCFSQAKEAYVQILDLPEITPEQKTTVQKGIVKALMGLRQFGEARAVMMKLAADPSLTLAEKLPTQIEIGTTCMLERKYPEARAELTKALSMEGISESDKADIQLQIGLCYYGEQDLEHAKSELQKVLTMPGANMRLNRDDGWGNYVPAREARLRLLKMNPADEKEEYITVFFVGSSLTLRGYMPLVVEQLSESAPAGRPRIISGTHLRGGTGIEVFWEDGETPDTARGKLLSFPWDVVVLETSVLRAAESNLKYGHLFCDFARSRNIKPVIYESHLKQDAAYPADHTKYHDDEVVLGKTVQSPLAPVVLAEMLYLKAVPTAQIGMFYDDWIHPSQKGIYLAACCIYSTITGYSPIGLSNQGLPEAEAKALQEAAWKAVQEANPDLKPWK